MTLRHKEMTTPKCCQGVLLETRPLFGGAVTCRIPSTFQDVSLLRDVPDNQEAFADTTSEAVLIVEVLEIVPGGVEECFKDIAQCNEAKSYEIEAVREFQDAVLRKDLNVVVTCVGIQRGIVKFREQDEMGGNDVRLWLAMITLPEASAELLLSVSVPIKISPTSSSAARGFRPETDPTHGRWIFESALRSLDIMDYGLFA